MRRERIFSFLQVVLDVAIVYFSYYLWLRVGTLLGFQYTERNIASLQTFVPYVLAGYVILFFFYRLYDISEIDFYDTFLGIFFSSLIVFVLGFALPFFLRAFAVPRTVIIFAFIVQIILLTFAHWIVRSIYINTSASTKVLLISRNAQPDMDYLKGIRNGKVDIKTMLFESDTNYPSLEKIFKEFDMFVLDDSLDSQRKSELLKFFAYENKPVYLVPGAYELMLLNPRTHFVNDLTLFEINLVNISGIERIVKRAIDIIVSLFALIVFSPVILIVSLGIILDSGRPVFFLQERAGVSGKVFKTIKFRTMIKDAEKYTGAVLSSGDNDPRITRIGRFLRKTGLDEIPQFINVLKGDLSIVGPRPERPELIEKIQKETPSFDMRLKVKPGITGFAQLHGKYDTPSDDKLKMDLLYAKQRNVVLTDIYVMFNTVKLFLSPHKRK